MPRIIDHDKRRRAIVDATLWVLAKQGLNGLTLKAVAERLGGTVSLVTHYYTSRQALVNDLSVRIAQSWELEIARIEMGVESSVERLCLFLKWLLPLSEEGILEEGARIRLLAEGGQDPVIQGHFAEFDTQVRAYLRTRLCPLVREDELDMNIDLLRTLISGICLSVIERPGDWPASRQWAVVSRALGLMNIMLSEKENA